MLRKWAAPRRPREHYTTKVGADPGKCVNAGQAIRRNRRCDAARMPKNSVTMCRVATSCMKQGKKEKFSFRRGGAVHAPLPDQRAQRRRLERLVQHCHIERARLVAHLRAAVGGDENRLQIRPKAGA